MPLLHNLHAVSPHMPLQPMRRAPQQRNHVAKAGHDDLSAPAGQDRGGDRLRHGVDLEGRQQEGGVVAVALEQRGLGVALVDDDGAHLGRGVQGRELGGQALVEGQRGGLGRAVVDHLGDGDVGGQAGDGDDHAVVARDQARQELLGEQVVGDGVDVEGEADVLLGGLEDGLSARDAGVQHQDRGVADGLADLGRDGGDGG